MPTKETPKKPGRPSIDDKTLEKALIITESMVALDAKWPQIVIQLLKQKPPINISFSTIKRLIKKKYKLNFEQFKDKSKEGLRTTLKQKAITMAGNGNATMLIFCLKNICNWSDKTEIQNAKPIEITLGYKLEGDKEDD